MSNHPNRSGAIARRTVSAVLIAVADMDALFGFYRDAERDLKKAETPDITRRLEREIRLIDAVGVYRFGDAWGARVG